MYIINNVIPEYADKEDNTRVYSLKSECVAPVCLLLFHRMFESVPGSYLSTHFININNLKCAGETVFYPSMIDDTGENCHYGTNIYYYDYYEILFDYESSDNGHGSLYINMNPKSKEYGNVFSYSSSNDGVISCVGKSFIDLITVLVSKEKICCSVCDSLNNFYCKCDEN